ncbi:hypothetical protein F53441_13816 [Fusarium austroafricanum]|uniref:Uncharacterized protein n=1 Tax=Fusarium austroafricanum TaxID=2364996 RepID=A0A8H4JKT7_9HYPO|nr:hypothetical protein F53441_13816 [Fusarium austroafricanum]
MFPHQGVTWWAGKTMNIGWTGGYDIKGSQNSTFSMEIRHFGAKYKKDDTDTIQIFSNKTFHYPSPSWDLWNPDCLDTWISYNWTIPKDFNVSDTKFVVWLFNTTDPKNKTSMMSDLFFIDSKFTKESTAASKTEPATVTPLLVQETVTSKPAPTLEITDNLQETTTASVGLSTGAMAGIGAGIGVFVLLLLLAGLFLYRRKKRQPLRVMSPGFEKSELYEKTVRHSIAEANRRSLQGLDNAILQARDSAIYQVPAGAIRVVSVSDQESASSSPPRISYQINRDPIEMPESLISSPKRIKQKT